MVEKYPKGDGAKKEAPSDSKINQDQQNNLQKELAEFRVRQKERYGKRKQEVIARTVEAAKLAQGVDDDEPEFDQKEAKKASRARYRERIKSYREALKEQKDMSASDFAFAEITDFQFNQEAFRGENGWLDEFQKTDAKDKMSLEEFVLEKQYAELTSIRETLLEARVQGKIVDLYPDLEGDDKKAERTKKNKEVSKDAKDFFKNSSSKVEEYLKAKAPQNIDLRKALLASFKTDVFGDIKASDTKAQTQIEGLFDELMTDYEAMLSSMEKAKLLNPKMVQLLMNEQLTEEDWNEQLALEAQKQAKKLADQAKQMQQETSVMAGGPVNADMNGAYYGDRISAAEKLGANSKIVIEQVAPGEYLIKFPGEEGAQISRFSVRQVKEGGKTFNVYVFHDPLMDKKALVRDGSFRGQVNGLYLEHVMSDSLKHGKDYLGPGLNDIIRDQEMYNIAEKLFFPKKLSEMVLTAEQTENFKRMMLLLVSPQNNQPGEGIYGNLLAMRSRVALLEYALGMDGGSKAIALYNFLNSSTKETLAKTSLEKVCKQIGVPANYGNFSKS
jgi:hypothetical protein